MKQVDLNINNLLGVFNTALISAYCNVDQRFQIMAVYLRSWAKQMEIIGAANKYLSSYALTLMIIAFLQKKNVLPNLQQKLDKKTDVRNIQSPHYTLKPIINYNKKKGKNQKDKHVIFELNIVDIFFQKDQKRIDEIHS